ncbi:MAG TPA: hypothetical protein DCX95_02850 [Elusimicrobia bacterium]|nr:hypothetical protein [Elusimicrobiota bacterium]
MIDIYLYFLYNKIVEKLHRRDTENTEKKFKEFIFAGIFSAHLLVFSVALRLNDFFNRLIIKICKPIS